MTGYEPGTSSAGSDHIANCASATAFVKLFDLYVDGSIVLSFLLSKTRKLSLNASNRNFHSFVLS